MKLHIKTADNKGLETHSLFTRLVRIFTVPLLNHIPAKFLQRLMKSSSYDAKTVVENTGSALALEAMYTRHHRSLFARGVLQGVADVFWHHCISQPKALRNRLKIVEDLLEKEIIARADKKEIVILSVGGGSSRSVMHALLKFSQENASYDGSIKVINYDKDEKAIDLGKELAQKFNLSHHFEWINGDVQNVGSLIPPGSIDIVEMVGLFDYFPEERGIEVVRQIHKVLKAGGTFIVGNVYPNSEMPFVYKTGWPRMYYRSPEEIGQILLKAGFVESPTILFEPLNVHIIALIKK